MLQFIIGLVVGNMLCGKFSLSDIFHVSYTDKGKGSGPSPLPTTTTTMVNFPEQAPAGLPAWPSGWKASIPPTGAQIERAQALLPMMSMGQVKYEQGPSGWEAYWKHKTGTKIGVTVHIPRQSASAPAKVSV
jgi:hypothetical protein